MATGCCGNMPTRPSAATTRHAVSGFFACERTPRRVSFTWFLCWDQDRFGRFDPIEGGYWILPFRNAGVRLETIAQGRIDWNDFAGRLLYLVQQEAKHAYLRDLSRNVLRGQLAKAREGEAARTARHRTATGWKTTSESSSRKRLRWCAGSLTSTFTAAPYVALLASLNAEGLRSPRGKQWRTSTVRSLLVNKKYTGAFVWGKYAAGYYHGTENGEIVPRQKTDKKAPDKLLSSTRIGLRRSSRVRSFGPCRRRLEKQRRRHLAFTPAWRTVSAQRPAEVWALRVRDDRLPLESEEGWRATEDVHVLLAPLSREEGMHEEHDFGGSSGGVRGSHHPGELPFRGEPGPAAESDATGVSELVPSPTNRSTLRASDGGLKNSVAGSITGLIAFSRRLPSLTNTLYAKLEQLRAERDRLRRSARRCRATEDGTDRREFKEVEEAISALADLRGAFEKADPADTRELLTSVGFAD